MMPIWLDSKYFCRNLRDFNVKVEFISGLLFDHIYAGVVATTIHDLCLIKCLKILYCLECCAKWFSYCRNILELFLEIKIVCMSKCWSWNPKSKFMVSDKLFSTYCYFLYIKSYKFYLHISLLALLVILEIKISPFYIILAMNHKPTYYLIDN